MSRSSHLLLLCISVTTSAARAAEPAEESARPPGTACCGALSGAFDGEAFQPDGDRPRASGTSGCICVKYKYMELSNGICQFYATDCYGMPFMWEDLCDTPPGNCDQNGCGTCFYYTEQPAPRLAANRAMPELMDHTAAPALENGAAFFETPFFVRVWAAGRDEPIRAKVFPVVVPRRELNGDILPAQVFYPGVEVKEFPAGERVRPVHGLASGRHQCQVVDHSRVLQIRTHTALTNE